MEAQKLIGATALIGSAFLISRISTPREFPVFSGPASRIPLLRTQPMLEALMHIAGTEARQYEEDKTVLYRCW
jgi:hypothetical protein